MPATASSGSGRGYRWYVAALWVLELPPGIRAAAAVALLLGGFGLQFGVTNPLMATRVFHLGAAGFGLMATFVAVGGIAGNFYSSRRPDPGRPTSEATRSAPTTLASWASSPPGPLSWPRSRRWPAPAGP